VGQTLSSVNQWVGQTLSSVNLRINVPRREGDGWLAGESACPTPFGAKLIL
jgi:hypothetical protein